MTLWVKAFAAMSDSLRSYPRTSSHKLSSDRHTSHRGTCMLHPDTHNKQINVTNLGKSSEDPDVAAAAGATHACPCWMESREPALGQVPKQRRCRARLISFTHCSFVCTSDSWRLGRDML